MGEKNKWKTSSVAIAMDDLIIFRDYLEGEYYLLRHFDQSLQSDK